MTFSISRARTLAVGAFALLSVVATSASALSYSEGTDLLQTGTALGALSAGANTVSGRVSGGPIFGVPVGNGFNDAVPDLMDRFTATLGAGQVITGVSLSVSGFPIIVLVPVDASFDVAGIVLGQWAGSITGQSPFGGNISGNGQAPGAFGGNAGGPATLDVSVSFLGFLADLMARDPLTTPLDFGFDYVVTINVRQLAVPEPGALALLGAALAGLAFARRRRA